MVEIVGLLVQILRVILICVVNRRAREDEKTHATHDFLNMHFIHRAVRLCFQTI